MSTKQQAYDSTPYGAVLSQTHALGTGGATVNAKVGKFIAHTAMIIKAASVWLDAMGTGADSDTNASLSVIKITGGTATSTLYTNTFGSSGGASTCGTCSMFALSSISNNTLASGDMFYVQRGTDATLRGAIVYEYQIVPGANLTV